MLLSLACSPNMEGDWDSLIFRRCSPNIVRCEGRSVGQEQWRSQKTGLDGCRQYRLLALWLLLWNFSLLISLLLMHPFTHWISYFLCFPPHYILKVNPINTEITSWDKLLGRAVFLSWTFHVVPFRINNLSHWTGTTDNLSAIIYDWNKGQMKEWRFFSN